MEKTDSLIVVQKLQEYIERNLQEPITLSDLARQAGYSPWHIGHMFKEVTGRSPFEYIRLRRLSEAALVIRDQNKKVLDVALDFVFDSQEGFTRAFSREFGIAPYKYHKNTPPIRLYMPEKVYDTYRALNHVYNRKERMNIDMKTVFVQVIERPIRKCLVKRGREATEYFKYCEEVGCEVWDILTSVKEALYEPIGMWMPESMRNGASEYIQGVEVPVDYQNVIPEGFELIELPPCQMMVFQGESYDDEHFAEAIDEVWEHIDRFNPETYGYSWAPEEGPRFQLIPMGYRGYIEARPVKKMS